MAKRVPREPKRPKRAPREPQERPKSVQERPRVIQERPERVQETQSSFSAVPFRVAENEVRYEREEASDKKNTKSTC